MAYLKEFYFSHVSHLFTEERVKPTSDAVKAVNMQPSSQTRTTNHEDELYAIKAKKIDSLISEVSEVFSLPRPNASKATMTPADFEQLSLAI